ncbi:basic proline-rich protein-like [Macrobrachium nipponense]|uniref:basic proline-rich protein-like n=1 Tax=Macrobrachium nipponense TaxID=159736 RepID=UPI0030C81825
MYKQGHCPPVPGTPGGPLPAVPEACGPLTRPSPGSLAGLAAVPSAGGPLPAALPGKPGRDAAPSPGSLAGPLPTRCVGGASAHVQGGWWASRLSRDAWRGLARPSRDAAGLARPSRDVLRASPALPGTPGGPRRPSRDPGRPCRPIPRHWGAQLPLSGTRSRPCPPVKACPPIPGRLVGLPVPGRGCPPSRLARRLAGLCPPVPGDDRLRASASARPRDRRAAGPGLPAQPSWDAWAGPSALPVPGTPRDAARRPRDRPGGHPARQLAGRCPPVPGDSGTLPSPPARGLPVPGTPGGPLPVPVPRRLAGPLAVGAQSRPRDAGRIGMPAVPRTPGGPRDARPPRELAGRAVAGRPSPGMLAGLPLGRLRVPGRLRAPGRPCRTNPGTPGGPGRRSGLVTRPQDAWRRARPSVRPPVPGTPGGPLPPPSRDAWRLPSRPDDHPRTPGDLCPPARPRDSWRALPARPRELAGLPARPAWHLRVRLAGSAACSPGPPWRAAARPSPGDGPGCSPCPAVVGDDWRAACSEGQPSPGRLAGRGGPPVPDAGWPVGRPARPRDGRLRRICAGPHPWDAGSGGPAAARVPGTPGLAWRAAGPLRGRPRDALADACPPGSPTPGAGAGPAGSGRLADPRPPVRRAARPGPGAGPRSRDAWRAEARRSPGRLAGPADQIPRHLGASTATFWDPSRPCPPVKASTHPGTPGGPLPTCSRDAWPLTDPSPGRLASFCPPSWDSWRAAARRPREAWRASARPSPGRLPADRCPPVPGTAWRVAARPSGTPGGPLPARPRESLAGRCRPSREAWQGRCPPVPGKPGGPLPSRPRDDWRAAARRPRDAWRAAARTVPGTPGGPLPPVRSLAGLSRSSRDAWQASAHPSPDAGGPMPAHPREAWRAAAHQSPDAGGPLPTRPGTPGGPLGPPARDTWRAAARQSPGRLAEARRSPGRLAGGGPPVPGDAWRAEARPSPGRLAGGCPPVPRDAWQAEAARPRDGWRRRPAHPRTPGRAEARRSPGRLADGGRPSPGRLAGGGPPVPGTPGGRRPAVPGTLAGGCPPVPGTPGGRRPAGPRDAWRRNYSSPPAPVIFIHDRRPIHTARIVQEWFQGREDLQLLTANQLQRLGHEDRSASGTRGNYNPPVCFKHLCPSHPNSSSRK